MTEIMPFPENNILFYWAAPHGQCPLDKWLDNKGEKYQSFRNGRLVFFVAKNSKKGLTKGEKNAAKPFEARNSKEAAAHGQIPDSVKRKS